jgi:hypothetical protein
VTLAKMFAGPAGMPRRVDPVRQETLLGEYREQFLARVDFLDRRAASFRFDDYPLDASLPAQVRHGIERRLARLRELAAGVRGYAAAGRWSEAAQHYESAERVAIDTEHWLARGRLGIAAQQAAKQRTEAARKGGEIARRRAAASRQAFASAFLAEAKEYRRLHPGSSVSAVIKHLRRLRDLDESDDTIRRYLRSFGLT